MTETVGKFFRQLIAIEANPRKGLMPVEWVVMGYLLVTALFILLTSSGRTTIGLMAWTRVQALAVTIACWGIYRWKPCRLTILLRIAGQMLLLGLWYPDTYELNRVFLNLDHVFAPLEEAIFGCQPALAFSQQYSSPWISEAVIMGYVSYYPLFVGLSVYYFICRYEQFERVTFIILASFFLSYVIFIFLPVAGPQFYFKAAGIENIAAGIYPNLGDYFGQLAFDVKDPQFSLPIPGYTDGFFYHILEFTHDAGERPTAAFPSSHVGVTVVVMWLAWESRNKWLFYGFLPFAVLLFFGTFYIQAHYAIDAIAGLFFGTLCYFFLRWIFDKYGSRKFASP